MLKLLFSLGLAWGLAACATDESAKTSATATAAVSPGFVLADHTAPPLPREFRGAWVATVANIDWPSKPGLSAEAMRAEIVDNVAQAKKLGINALMLQVRANADAIYPSALEPWADVLTGVQGRTPTFADPKAGPFDPLQVWVDEARQAGIEIHAWFNPYRARHTAARSAPAATHISQTRAGLVKNYGTFGWLDPGEAEAAEHSLKVIEDVVRRYDIAGVHVDDYFYPYPVRTVTASVTGGTQSLNIDFPDGPSWARYQQSGGKLSKADWRRDNVDRFVRDMDQRVRAIKPWMQVSVSPFGLGKPALRPPGIAGFSQYDELYADVERWVAEGWMDFLVPQLYWPIAQKAQAFPVLLDYWAGQNPKGVQIYSGLYTSRINSSTTTWQPTEVYEQIGITRERTKANPLLNGHVHFSWVALKQNRLGVGEGLSRLYPTEALPPVSWRVTGPSEAEPPRITPLSVVAGRRLGLLDLALSRRTEQAALWQRERGAWRLQLLSVGGGNIVVPALSKDADAIVVSGIDRYGRESARVSATLLPQPGAKP